jgi:hypothetical protein
VIVSLSVVIVTGVNGLGLYVLGAPVIVNLSVVITICGAALILLEMTNNEEMIPANKTARVVIFRKLDLFITSAFVSNRIIVEKTRTVG